MNFRGAWISAYGGADMGNKARWQTAPPALAVLSFVWFVFAPTPGFGDRMVNV